MHPGKSWKIKTQSWKAMKKSWKKVISTETHGKVVKFKILKTVYFHTVVHFFKQKPLNFTKLMSFMQQMNIMHQNSHKFFTYFLG